MLMEFRPVQIALIQMLLATRSALEFPWTLSGGFCGSEQRFPL